MSAASTNITPLEEERQFFAEKQEEWKSLFPGKVVLIKGRSLINTFDDAEAALAEGIETFGSEPFLIREVEQTEPLFIPALAFGILRTPVPA